MSSAIMEFNGRARPRIPLNVEERGSLVMLFAAAARVSEYKPEGEE